MADTAPDSRPLASRPLSPHLSIWRWHATMAASIAHRVSGIGLYAATAFFVVWLVALAAGPGLYEHVDTVLETWFGQVGLYGTVALVAYHAANGVRHLFWDAVKHLNPNHAELTAWLAFLFAVAAPTALFAYFFFSERP